VTERLKAFGADPEDAEWDAKKRGDGSWLVQLTFISGGRLHTAEWSFDPRRRHVLPADDNAARMSLPGAEPLQPAPPPPGEATVTHLAPRLSTASGYGPVGPGNGAMGHVGPGNGLGNGGRARHERPGSGWSAGPEPQVAEPEAPEPHQTEAPAAATPSAPSAPPPPPASPPGPARVAAQVARPARPAEDSRVAQARQESPAPPGAADPAPVAPVTPPAEAAPPTPPAPQEAAGDQAARQGRKSARGRRSSVPSWDEIMFGSARQRD
jgi:hypothetical protein